METSWFQSKQSCCSCYLLVVICFDSAIIHKHMCGFVIWRPEVHVGIITIGSVTASGQVATVYRPFSQPCHINMLKLVYRRILPNYHHRDALSSRFCLTIGDNDLECFHLVCQRTPQSAWTAPSAFVSLVVCNHGSSIIYIWVGKKCATPSRFRGWSEDEVKELGQGIRERWCIEGKLTEKRYKKAGGTYRLSAYVVTLTQHT